MSTHDEIDKAVGAHGQWKHKLRSAIETGECESTPARVKLDSNCSFGKWLHQRIDPAMKSTSYYDKVVGLHREFHREAGSILEMALNGKKEAANDRMKLGGKFSGLSSQLIAVLKEWQANI